MKLMKWCGIFPEKVYWTKKEKKNPNFYFINKSITDFDLLENSSVIISNYTIQFISPAIRQIIIDKIYKSLAWGSAFFFLKMNGSGCTFQ